MAFFVAVCGKVSIPNYSCLDNITMNPTRPDFKFLCKQKNSPHRTESVRAGISHGDVRGKVQVAYHAGQARESGHGPR